MDELTHSVTYMHDFSYIEHKLGGFGVSVLGFGDTSILNPL
jgi:hypothetical protein